MVAPVFTDEELEGLRRFPEIGREDVFRFFTLTPTDVAFVDPGRGRGPADRLGLAVALCSLPWLGFGARVEIGGRTGRGGLGPAGRGAASGRATAPRSGRDPLVWALGEDAHRASSAGGAVPGMAGADHAGAERVGRVPAGSGDGARLADAAVPAGV